MRTARNPAARGARWEESFCPLGSYSFRRHVGAPAAVLGNLALALHEGRFAENPDYGGAVVEAHLADVQSGRLLEKDLGQSAAGHRPDLDLHASPCPVGDSHHRGILVVDGPNT